MSLHYICSHEHRCVRAVLRHDYHAFDIWELFARQRTGGSWSYRTLVEVRYSHGSPPSDETLRQILEVDARPGRTPRGPLGILVHGPVLTRIAARYALLAGRRRSVRVFTTTIEAEAWLTGD